MGLGLNGEYHSATGTWTGADGKPLYGDYQPNRGTGDPNQAVGLNQTSNPGNGVIGSNGGVQNTDGTVTVSKDGITYDPNADYAADIIDAIQSGKSAAEVQRLLNLRNTKARDLGLPEYLYDDIANQAKKYIENGGKKPGGEPGSSGLGGDDVKNTDGLNSSLDANQLAVDQAVARLQNQKPAINESYNQLLRENELNNKLEQENLRRGSIYGNYNTTGMADSFRVAQSTAYQGLRNKSELERKTALQEIENAINDTKFTGDINAANLKSEYYTRLAEIALENAREIRNHDWDVSNMKLNNSFNLEELKYSNSVNQSSALMSFLYSLVKDGVYNPQFAKILGLPESMLKNIADIVIDHRKKNLTGYPSSSI